MVQTMIIIIVPSSKYERSMKPSTYRSNENMHTSAVPGTPEDSMEVKSRTPSAHLVTNSTLRIPMENVSINNCLFVFYNNLSCVLYFLFRAFLEESAIPS